MCVIARCAFRVALIVLGAACTLATSIPSALAQSWPQRTVKLIIPLPPGTGTDIAGRLLAEHLAERWAKVEYITIPTQRDKIAGAHRLVG